MSIKDALQFLLILNPATSMKILTTKNLASISLILLYSLIYSQTYNPKLFNEKQFLNLLKKYNGGELPPSFFVVQGYTNIEVFTNAPAMIKRIEEIKQYQLCPYIFYIWKDNGGIGKKNFYKYLKENYYIDTNVYHKVFVSDSLYDLLGTYPNSEIHYFHKGKRIFFCDGKYERVPKTSLPYEVIKIEEPEKSVFIEDENGYHSNGSFYYPINDTLGIELADIGKSEERIRLVNLLNGKIYKKFNLNGFDYVNLFKKYFGNTIEISEDAIKELERIRRTPFRVEEVQVISENKIYLQSTPIIPSIAKDTVYVPSEFKNKTLKFPPGSIIQNSYGLWLITDTSLTIKDTILINDIEENNYTSNNFILYTNRFFKTDSLYYLYVYSYNEKEDKTYEQIFQRNKTLQFIHSFKRENNVLNFYKKEKPVFSRDFGQSFPYLIDGLAFFGTNQDIYSYFPIFPEIYSIKQEKPILKITNQPLNYQFVGSTNWNYDNISKEYIPFYVLAQGYLLNKRIIYSLYKLNNDWYINLYDTEMNLIDSQKVTAYFKEIKKYFDKSLWDYALFVSPNYIYLPICESGGCKVLRYKISTHPVNKNYFSNKSSFK